jgi:hypothetical protein
VTGARDGFLREVIFGVSEVGILTLRFHRRDYTVWKPAWHFSRGVPPGGVHFGGSTWGVPWVVHSAGQN